MPATIRLATPDDAEAILTIYAPIVRETAISFEVEPPTRVEMQARIATTLQHLPWLVCDRQGEILGYVYASAHRTRAAYQWSVDVTVYIHPEARRTGMGRALYTALFALLTLQGLSQCFAGITLPNPASVGLHESLGFQPVGVYRSVGDKLGAWHDVGWWQRGLQPCQHLPAPPTAFAVLRHTPAWDAALEAGRALLRSVRRAWYDMAEPQTVSRRGEDNMATTHPRRYSRCRPYPVWHDRRHPWRYGRRQTRPCCGSPTGEAPRAAGRHREQRLTPKLMPTGTRQRTPAPCRRGQISGLGCGNPIALASLRPGRRCLTSAVGPALIVFLPLALWERRAE